MKSMISCIAVPGGKMPWIPSRFNSPDGSYGVMYTSEQREGAFAETFLRRPDETLVSMKLILAKRATCAWKLRAKWLSCNSTALVWPAWAPQPR